MSDTPTSNQIETMMAQDDFAGLGQAVQDLMKLPQSHCKTRGDCCRVATFKGTLSYQDIQAMAASDDKNAINAQEFLVLFEPYPSQDAVRQVAPGFVDRVREKVGPEKADQIGFFHCRFVGKSGLCQIHEDRPVGCRVYPFPHESTIYHPGCGFEDIGTKHWQLVQHIQTFFDKKLKEISQEVAVLESQGSQDNIDPAET